MLISKITSIAGYLPEKILTNDDLSKIVDTNDEWIYSRTGIKKRHIAGESETCSDMALASIKKLLAISSVKPEEIDAIIVATTTPDMSFPSVACIVQGKIGAHNAFAFDISAACSGFIYGLFLANQMISTGNAKKIILVGADKTSSIVDWTDRSTCVLFGDGAGAVLIESEDVLKKNINQSSRIIDCAIQSDGTKADILYTSGGVSTTKTSGHIMMNGSEVFKNAILNIYSSTISLLKKNNIPLDQIEAFVPHQANQRIIDAVAKHMSVDKSKMVSTVEMHGNTSAASIPLALEEGIKQNKIKKGSNIVLQSIGSGLTWGTCIVKW